jgi:hypothetical protein
MIEINTAFHIEDYDDDGAPLVGNLKLELENEEIILENLRIEIAKRFSDRKKHMVFPNLVIFSHITIIKATKIETLCVDQMSAIFLKNSQKNKIHIGEIKTDNQAKCSMIQISNFNLNGARIEVECDLLLCDSSSEFFPTLENSEISVLNFFADPKYTFTENQSKHLTIKNCWIGKLGIFNVLVATPIDISKPIKFVEIEQDSIVEVLNMTQVMYKNRNTKVEIITDKTSNLLNLEILDQNKIQRN